MSKTIRQEILSGEKEIEFLSKGKRIPEECKNCKWKNICMGGCKRDWVESDGCTQNYFCSSFQKFFEYAETRMAGIAHLELMTGI